MRLMRTLRPRARAGDRGGVVTLVAIVLGTGVLMGAGALAVDVGQLHAERDQLQSGADGAAVAVAQNCVLKPNTCASQQSVATTYAGLNANDGTSAASVCGTMSGLPACGAGVSNLGACIGTAPSTPYAEVRTSTRRTDGGTLLPPSFAGALLGEEYHGATVHACARAVYFYPSTAHGLAITLSTCEWNKLALNTEAVIYIHGTNKGDCPTSNSGWDKPGGFGYLDDDANCEATITLGFANADPGSGATNECKAAFLQAWTSRKVVYLPVYDYVTGTGTNSKYHIAGFSAFVLTGYRISGSDEQKSWLTNTVPCKGNDRCLSGYFVSGLLPSASGSGGTFGAKVVKLVG